MDRLFSLMLLFLLAACTGGNEEVYMKPVDSKWNKNTVLSYEFELKDAQRPKNIIFVVRNNNEYPYSNLRIISTLNKSGAKSAKPDTLNYILAKPNGEWIGTGFGTTKETLFQYRLNYKFPQNGKYTVTVQQVMRKDVLPGIEDFGIKIEQAQP